LGPTSSELRAHGFWYREKIDAEADAALEQSRGRAGGTPALIANY